MAKSFEEHVGKDIVPFKPDEHTLGGLGIFNVEEESSAPEIVVKRTKKSIAAITVLSVLFAAALGGVGLLYYERSSYSSLLEAKDDDIHDLSAEVENLKALIQDLEGQVKSLTTENEDLKKTNETQAAILEEREEFLAAVKEYYEITEAAIYYVDTSYFNYKLIDTAADTVYAERSDPRKINEQTSAVIEEIEKIEELVTAEQERRKKNVSNTYAEKALDDISGGTVDFVIDKDGCRNTLTPYVLACVRGDNPLRVYVVDENAAEVESYEFWFPIMMHEFAHTIQLRNYGTITVSAGYINEFESDLEWYADCMAQWKIGASYVSSYGNTCTTKQLQLGKDAWSGVFN